VALAACGGGGSAGGGVPMSLGDLNASAGESKPAGHDAAVLSKTIESCSVEFYGDSIMAGNGTAETPTMTFQRIRPGFKVVEDHAVAGTMLSMLYPSFGTDSRSARFVVIENGVIDAWRGVSPFTMQEMYRSMFEKLRSEGRVPVLTGFSRQSLGGVLDAEQIGRRDPYDAFVKNYASSVDVAFADWGSAWFDGPADLLDGVHPNKTYSDRRVEQLASTLDKLAPECAVSQPPESPAGDADAGV
jgi:hypothetical protein